MLAPSMGPLPQGRVSPAMTACLSSSSDLGAGVAELVDEFGHRGVGRVPGEGGSEPHDDVVPELHGVGDPVRRRVGARPTGRNGPPPVP